MKKYSIVLLLFSAVLLFGNTAPWDGESFDWSKVPEQYPGIRHLSLTSKVPRPNIINILRVDLQTPQLDFAVTPRGDNYGKPMPDAPKFNIATRRERTKDFLFNHRKAGKNMVLAVNTAPWAPWCPPWTHTYAAKMGLLISEGEQVDCINAKNYRPVFYQTKDGKFGMKIFNPGEDYSHLRNAVSGFYFNLENGKVTERKHNRLMPCCGFGLDKSCRYLCIVIIDGRQKGFSEGAQIAEVGKYLKKLGAYNGIHMDGGGSATVTVWDPEGRFNGFKKPHADGTHTLNHQPKAYERLVGCNVGFYYRNKSDNAKSESK